MIIDLIFFLRIIYTMGNIDLLQTVKTITICWSSKLSKRDDRTFFLLWEFLCFKHYFKRGLLKKNTSVVPWSLV